MTTSLPASPSFGGVLPAWRTRRRRSQEHLAAEALVSTRHLSYLETSKAAPSREMVLRLSQPLGLPLREQNQLLAAGFAPQYAQRPLDDPALSAARQAIDAVLGGHGPNPALAVDRRWNLHAANPAAQRVIPTAAQSIRFNPTAVRSNTYALHGEENHPVLSWMFRN